MSNLTNEINRTARQVEEIMESGYTRAEALQLIQAAAMSKLADCIQTNYNGKPYLHISGAMATYEQ